MQQRKDRKLTDENQRLIKDICVRYAYNKAEVINILNEVQSVIGFLPKFIQQAVALELNVSEAKIGGLVNFYSFFRSYPKGKYVISVCQGRSCSLRRAVDVLDSFKRSLSLDVGQTTIDGKITLLSTGCMGACGLGPVTMVNDTTYPRNNPENAEKIVIELQNKDL